MRRLEREHAATLIPDLYREMPGTRRDWGAFGEVADWWRPLSRRAGSVVLDALGPQRRPRAR